jgi:hypothetical protein
LTLFWPVNPLKSAYGNAKYARKLSPIPQANMKFVKVSLEKGNGPEKMDNLE